MSHSVEATAADSARVAFELATQVDHRHRHEFAMSPRLFDQQFDKPQAEGKRIGSYIYESHLESNSIQIADYGNLAVMVRYKSTKEREYSKDFIALPLGALLEPHVPPEKAARMHPDYLACLAAHAARGHEIPIHSRSKESKAALDSTMLIVMEFPPLSDAYPTPIRLLAGDINHYGLSHILYGHRELRAEGFTPDRFLDVLAVYLRMAEVVRVEYYTEEELAASKKVGAQVSGSEAEGRLESNAEEVLNHTSPNTGAVLEPVRPVIKFIYLRGLGSNPLLPERALQDRMTEARRICEKNGEEESCIKLVMSDYSDDRQHPRFNQICTIYKEELPIDYNELGYWKGIPLTEKRKELNRIKAAKREAAKNEKAAKQERKEREKAEKAEKVEKAEKAEADSSEQSEIQVELRGTSVKSSIFNGMDVCTEDLDKQAEAEKLDDENDFFELNPAGQDQGARQLPPME
ncbi:hypothetical protein BJ508DRAFT_303602 [Ascobolus immersus RN42]|uniref:Uncharacterized protein n=1 Tax=Ascobolus immersus RN42 TaxID=1160509 RepID=A0A3N4IFE6_ASCIM|nr:hypothetical protein BJ508DRAFT_303602 [Ascobolus immersus RN42]